MIAEQNIQSIASQSSPLTQKIITAIYDYQLTNGYPPDSIIASEDTLSRFCLSVTLDPGEISIIDEEETGNAILVTRYGNLRLFVDDSVEAGNLLLSRQAEEDEPE